MLGISCKWEHTVIILSVMGLLHLAELLQVYLCCCMGQNSFPFQDWIIFHCLYTLCLVYPLISPWTLSSQLLLFSKVKKAFPSPNSGPRTPTLPPTPSFLVLGSLLPCWSASGLDLVASSHCFPHCPEWRVLFPWLSIPPRADDSRLLYPDQTSSQGPMLTLT